MDTIWVARLGKPVQGWAKDVKGKNGPDRKITPFPTHYIKNTKRQHFKVNSKRVEAFNSGAGQIHLEGHMHPTALELSTGIIQGEIHCSGFPFPSFHYRHREAIKTCILTGSMSQTTSSSWDGRGKGCRRSLPWRPTRSATYPSLHLNCSSRFHSPTHREVAFKNCSASSPL